jgi:antitoxin component of MazEF toxin-antitoxin module
MYGMFKAKIRKVGTSFGILLPKEVIKEQKLTEGEEVNVSVLKEKTMKEAFKMFGAARGTKPFKRDRRDRF